MHNWHDSWPHWGILYNAQYYFGELYYRCTKKRPITKEKWGSIRYEFDWTWITSEKEAQVFRECLRRTIRKYPQVAAEIVLDAGHVLQDDYFEGWCNGVATLARNTYWCSDKRPNGV